MLRIGGTTSVVLAAAITFSVGISTARAQVFEEGVWLADRDNYNSSFPDFIENNFGSSIDFHFARSNGHTTWYGDWSAADKAAMLAVLTADPGPGRHYVVELIVYQSTTNANEGRDHPPNIIAPIEAFRSSTDWVESEATHSWAANGVGWDGDLNNNFFSLGGVMNSVGMPGWDNTANAPNAVELDIDLMMALLTDPEIRGIRAHQFQDGGAAQHQRNWSSEHATLGPRIVITNVPEPASLGLLGIAGLLLRRQSGRPVRS